MPVNVKRPIIMQKYWVFVSLIPNKLDRIRIGRSIQFTRPIFHVALITDEGI